MAAPNYEQIQSFNTVSSQLQQAAIDELMSEIYDGIPYDELIAEATRIAEKFAFLGAELGAQWYDLCCELAGIDAEPAELSTPTSESLQIKAEATVKNSQMPTIQQTLNYYMQNVINESIRMTGDANLWRDYERGLSAGKWARVPVGDTCAWCLMLASQGAWYVSKESALGKESGHYHDGCNCIAVYHADPIDIDGYGSKLGEYKSMYYKAENTRIANENGKQPYSYELGERISAARALHAERSDKPWTEYNETLIIMRYQNEGLH